MERNLESEISTATTQLELITSQAEQIRKDFIIETITFIHGWYWSKAEEIIKEKSQITVCLGVPNLSLLKKDVNQLQEQSSKIVNSFLLDKSLWWHLNLDTLPDLFSGHRINDPIEKAVRLAAGQLAPLLEKYNYLSTRDQDHELWREWDNSGNHHAPNARAIYPYQIEWSGRMKTLTTRYEELRKQTYPIIDTIKKLKSEKSRIEASDLWNKA